MGRYKSHIFNRGRRRKRYFKVSRFSISYLMKTSSYYLQLGKNNTYDPGWPNESLKQQRIRPRFFFFLFPLFALSFLLFLLKIHSDRVSGELLFTPFSISIRKEKKERKNLDEMEAKWMEKILQQKHAALFLDRAKLAKMDQVGQI